MSKTWQGAFYAGNLLPQVLLLTYFTDEETEAQGSDGCVFKGRAEPAFEPPSL